MKKYLLKYALLAILNIHNKCYHWAASIAIRLEGIHPKHRLMQYKEWFLKHINDDDVVLDIGSNTGAMPRLFAEKASFVYGIEIDKRLVKKALEQSFPSNARLLQGDATKFNYSNLKPISLITLSNVLEHIEHRVSFLATLIESTKWQKSKPRRVLIRVPMIDRDWITIYKKEAGVEWRLDPTHFTEYTMSELLNELSIAGLIVNQSEVRFGEAYLICTVSDFVDTKSNQKS